MSANYLKIVAKDLMGKYIEVYQGGTDHGEFEFADKKRKEKSIS